MLGFILLTGCSVNPATGEKQFTGLMPAGSEAQIGANEHNKILQEYGGLVSDQGLQRYVNEVGARVAKNTERPDVRYQFFVLNSPVINAFALPGGYVYITRGLMAVANSESELASVLGHEIGHITGRHQAARYSQGVLASLGASVLAAAVGDPGITQAIGFGSDLYMSSYSRGQESESDRLGIRYLSRAGYDVMAMPHFLDAMSGYINTESRVSGKGAPKFSYFSSHPQTGQRVSDAMKEARQYASSQQAGDVGRDRYLNHISGMAYGDGYEQGFARGRDFYHPVIGFMFSVPAGYDIINQPDQVIATGKDGVIIVLDTDDPRGMDPASYMVQRWMEGQAVAIPESIVINGRRAATVTFDGSLNGRPIDVRLVAIEWSPGKIFRFQFAIPRGAGGQSVENLKRVTYSFRSMTDSERKTVREQRIRIVEATAGDTVESMAQRMVGSFKSGGQVEMFRALNHITGSNRVVTGQKYKIIAD